MTYAFATPTIGLDEHEMRSIRRWLNEFAIVLGPPQRDIWLQRPPADFDRPAYLIKEVDRQDEDRGRSMTVSVVDWQLEVLLDERDAGSGFWEVKREVAEIRQRLLQSLRIPLYLYGWEFPSTMTLEELPSAGALPAGEVSVGLTAVSHLDEESLMGTTQQITVALNSAVRVIWERWPRGASLSKEFNVYAGAITSETLEQSAIADPDKRVVVEMIITNLAGGGAAPPTSSVFFANRYLRIDTDSIKSRVMEHPAADGLFNGIITFRTMTESVRIATPAGVPARTIGTVTIDGVEND